jgi:hypothetical protein
VPGDDCPNPPPGEAAAEALEKAANASLENLRQPHPPEVRDATVAELAEMMHSRIAAESSDARRRMDYEQYQELLHLVLIILNGFADSPRLLARLQQDLTAVLTGAIAEAAPPKQG